MGSTKPAPNPLSAAPRTLERMARGTEHQATREQKPCEHCGRPFQDRKRWAGRDQWDEVRYCSRACRSAAAAQRRRERRAS